MFLMFLGNVLGVTILVNKTRPGAKLQIEETYNNLILINIKV